MHLFFVHLVLKVNCALTLVKTAQSVQASMLAHRVGVPKELEVTLLSNVKQILVIKEETSRWGLWSCKPF